MINDHGRFQGLNLVPSYIFHDLQVHLGITNPDQGVEVTRHESRFGITSFIYTSRRPFHPQRLEEIILQSYFVEPDFMDEDEEEDEEKEKTEDEKKKMEAEKERKL